jgi:exodeoxyribonuclease-5
MSADTLILCATSRLAQSLRWQHDRAQAAAGAAQWPTLNTTTVAQWFATLAEAALLRGKAEGLLQRRVLDAFQESLLWEQVITDSIPDYATSFFDVPGMAATAAEAHELMVVWGVVPHGDDGSDETREFLRWRKKYLDLCSRQGLLDAAQWNEAVLALVGSGTLQLPREVQFAGFDNITPQERRLKALLAEQGVAVAEWQASTSAPSALEIRLLPEADAERRAVAQWAAAHLARNPAVQLGIVVPNLGKARDAIESALDDALHPALLRPSQVEAPRNYNFSLGKPLTQHPLIAVALELIELTCGSGEVEQSRIGELLRHPCWSAAINEADARAKLEAAMREKLPATTSVGRVLSFAQWFARDDEIEPPASSVRGEPVEPWTAPYDGPALSATRSSTGSDRTEGEERSANAETKLRLPQLLANLAAIETTRREWKKKTLPSEWASRIRQLLRAAGWPGERSLSSHEFQARQAFIDELNKLAALDGIVDGTQGAISARAAHRRLTQLCNAHVFQAETTNEPQLQVVGMLEAGGMHFDALWVMGMTDDVWPPAPRPNPLLPAEMQRAASAPNSSAQAQLAFANSIHQRLLQCAPDITFSFARMEGATELRPSPLLAPYLENLLQPVRPELVEGHAGFDRLSPNGIGGGLRANGEVWAAPIDDSVAPPVKEGEHVHGGTGLLKAQAICPAWAYFRYRLGAKKLQTPVEGLDAAARGSIVHEALRSFWVTNESSSRLRAMSDADRNAAIDNAVDDALIEYDDEHRAAPLPPVFRKLERERLQRLLANWLAVELQREQPFSVVSCEESIKVDIEGIVCNLQIDRIDELQDGRRIVIDYKTGAVAGYKSWAEMRITDPQLPIYAAIAQTNQTTSAVAFAKVQLDDSTFLGIASDDGLLPRVPGVDSRDGRKVFSADEFADWQAVLAHWRSSIQEIALEVKYGTAAVIVADAADLRYCDVLPILRLAERCAQWENVVAEGTGK